MNNSSKGVLIPLTPYIIATGACSFGVYLQKTVTDFKGGHGSIGLDLLGLVLGAALSTLAIVINVKTSNRKDESIELDSKLIKLQSQLIKRQAQDLMNPDQQLYYARQQVEKAVQELREKRLYLFNIAKGGKRP